MQLQGIEDIDAPIGDVFDVISKFESFERSAIRRGIDVQRLNDHSVPGPGLEWHTRFELSGKERQMHVILTAYEPSNGMRFESTGKGLDGVVKIDLLALSPRRTRLRLDMKVSANTVAATILLQSLRFARRNIDRRFKNKLAEFARDLEMGRRRSV